MMKVTKEALEELYFKFNRRAYVHPDPLEFLYAYPEVRDREIVGLIAASLAYGNVVQIIRSVRLVLEKLSPSPYELVMEASPRWLKKALNGFYHRWHLESDILGLLSGIKGVCLKYGSLQKCFQSGMSPKDDDLLTALNHFVLEIVAGKRNQNLLPVPSRGSACKRLHMYLRWMVRRDEVDPGGWDEISPSKLLVPVDTHMHRVSRRLKFTKRKQANLMTVREITAAFRKIVPEDPVRYDFALTRLGIHPKAQCPLFS